MTAGIIAVAVAGLTLLGKVYEVLQAHTSAAHWPPNQSASLYKPR